jgi:hypothetical protein
MKYFGYCVSIASVLIGISACEEKAESKPKIPQIISSGISYGEYSLGAKDSVNANIRLKFTPPTGKDKNGKLKFIVEIFPNSDFNNFKEVSNAFLEKGTDPFSSSSGNYLNSMLFTFIDKDGFEISKIEIKKPYDADASLTKKSDLPALEFRGGIFLAEKEALKIAECKLRASFTPKLKSLIGVSE